MNSSFTLDWFQHDGTGVFSHHFFNGVQVIIFRINKSLRQGSKTFLVFALPGCGYSSQGTPVEGFFKYYYMIFMAFLAAVKIFAGQFDSRLISLSAAVAKEGLA